VTPKRLAVLRELAYLEANYPWVQEHADGYWLPFHVRWFRSPENPPEVQELSVGAIAAHLRRLTRDGLVEAQGHRSHKGFKITDAGREVAARG
jgi:hypothetical protein